MTEERQKHDSVDRNYEIIINIPEKVIERLPEDFKLEDIGTIDLAEADAIANEKILFLTENDLIEGLEDFDLIPLKKEEKPAASAKAEPAVTISVIPPSEPPAIDGIASEDMPRPKKESPAGTGAEALRDTAAQIPPGESPYFSDDQWVPLEQLTDTEPPAGTSHDETAWVPLEKIQEPHRVGQEDANDVRIAEPESVQQAEASIDDFELEPVTEAEPEQLPVRSERLAGGVEIIDEEPAPPVVAAVTGDDQRISGKDRGPEAEPATVTAEALYDTGVIADQLPIQTDETARDGTAPADRDHDELILETSESVPAEEPVPAATIPQVKPGVAEKPKAVTPSDEGDDVVWLSFDADTPARVPSAPAETTAAVFPPVDDRRREPAVAAVSATEAAEDDKQRGVVIEDAVLDMPETSLDAERHPIMKEMLPDVLMAVGRDDPRVSFIDDRVLEKESATSQGIFDGSELDRITADMVVIAEGRGYNLREAGPGEDRDRVIAVSSVFTQQHKDLVLEIDDYYKHHDEDIDFIHSAIVEEDYGRFIRTIDDISIVKKEEAVSEAREILGMAGDEFSAMETILFGDTYQHVNLYEIFDFFAHETDRSGRSVRLEKNCTYLLANPESFETSERASIEEDITSSNALIYEEDPEEIRRLLEEKQGTLAPAKAAVVEVVDTVYDITDRVVILEDHEDVDRFVSTFPEEKQVDIKNLLKYLDGLFERLPENIIKKFASSEYFNLYLKVLNELDV